jgi:very-long-chain enoyl-CoA reductase
MLQNQLDPSASLLRERQRETASRLSFFSRARWPAHDHPPTSPPTPTPNAKQIGYSTVFFFEYFGPMVIYPLFYLLPHVFYSSKAFADPRTGLFPQKELVQTVACAYWVAHYAKRIAETFLVHRFGHATMPIGNLFKNCSYYYGFAAFVAYFVNHPRYTAAPQSVWLPCFALAALCQLSNLYCHVLLSGLRKPGDKGYSIPRGFLFDYITCANYSAEIWGWTLFTLGTRTAAAGLFCAAGAYQMAIWAKQKHRRLQKIFDGKDGRERYPKRWIMLPPFF